MGMAPGTWRISDPSTKVQWKEGISALGGSHRTNSPTVWRSVYGRSIAYEQLAEELFEQTGYGTRMLLGNWIGQVLGPVQSATLAEGKPPLSSLVVRAETGGVGEGYVNHQHPQGFATFAERQQAAAVDRLHLLPSLPRSRARRRRTSDDRAVLRQEQREGGPCTPTAKDLPYMLHRATTSGRCDYCE